jgi:von Willebrand factor A domain-containing protein 8
MAIKNVVKEEADDYFVILVSDANLRRYNIAPETISNIMKSNEVCIFTNRSSGIKPEYDNTNSNHKQKVNCFVIFIASLVEEAEVITKELPRGKSFVCLDTSSLPSIFKQIFNSSNLLVE